MPQHAPFMYIQVCSCAPTIPNWCPNSEHWLAMQQHWNTVFVGKSWLLLATISGVCWFLYDFGLCFDIICDAVLLWTPVWWEWMIVNYWLLWPLAHRVPETLHGDKFLNSARFSGIKTYQIYFDQTLNHPKSQDIPTIYPFSYGCSYDFPIFLWFPMVWWYGYQPVIAALPRRPTASFRSGARCQPGSRWQIWW